MYANRCFGKTMVTLNLEVHDDNHDTAISNYAAYTHLVRQFGLEMDESLTHIDSDL